MSFAKVYTRGNFGLEAPQVEVEVHISQGLPCLTIVGLAETSVKESKDRVRSAILNSGFDFPTKRLTINLAPADLPKDSARLDLPIAIGILVASGQIQAPDLVQYELIGELALDGTLRCIKNTLPIAIACNQVKRALILPKANAVEAAQLQQLDVYSALSLKQVCAHLEKSQLILPEQHTLSVENPNKMLDLLDIKGQLRPKRALEIAAAGEHSILFRGPPGTGKTLLASRLPSILPPLNEEDALTIASIHSAAQQNYIFGQRPFRSPHHTASQVALVGGGSRPKPGEITLAHLGVLFLDELPEFDRKALEVLRQPLEEHQVIISRASQQVTFPANFQLIAAMNPCPCGYAFNQDSRCQCSAEAIKRYQSKISGPLLDRIDLHIDVPPITIQELHSKTTGESSATVKQRVHRAYEFQLKRQGKTNQHLSPYELEKFASLSSDLQKLLSMAQERLKLSARAYHRVIKISRTIADLEQSPHILSHHLSEALSYRSPLEG